MPKIFVSKKEDDQILAKRMRQELEPFLGNHVEISMSQDMPAGAIWRDWIREELLGTDLLLFLITDMTKSTDWCVFEVGMFTPLSDREPKPIVCIYPAGQEMPSQISHVQGVECEPESIKAFLRDLFNGTLLDQPINVKLAEDENRLIGISEEIVGILTPENISESERVYYTRYVSFDIVGDQDSKSEVPAGCEITGDELSMEMFNLDKTRPGGKAWTWEQFKPYFAKALAAADTNSDEFFAEFESSILASCRGEKIKPSQRYMRSLTSEKKYRPVIHRRDYSGNGDVKIRVLFVQEPEPETGERNFTFAAVPGG